MDYAKLRKYICEEMNKAMDARGEIATDYEKRQEFAELSGRISALADVWNHMHRIHLSEEAE